MRQANLQRYICVWQAQLTQLHHWKWLPSLACHCGSSRMASKVLWLQRSGLSQVADRSWDLLQRRHLGPGDPTCC